MLVGLFNNEKFLSEQPKSSSRSLLHTSEQNFSDLLISLKQKVYLGENEKQSEENDHLLFQLSTLDSSEFEKLQKNMKEFERLNITFPNEKIEEMIDGEELDEEMIGDEILDEEMISDEILNEEMIEEDNIEGKINGEDTEQFQSSFIHKQNQLTEENLYLKSNSTSDISQEETPNNMFVNPDQDIKIIERSAQRIWEEVSTIINDLIAAVDEQMIDKDRPLNINTRFARLLVLLEQWASIENRNSVHTALLSKSNEHADQTEKIWNNLVQHFTKRQQLTMNQQYSQQAKVTATDIAKWLNNELIHTTYMENKVNSQPVMNQPLQMSKTEQFSIYFNTLERPELFEEQFMKQFQQIIKTSHFSPINKGNNMLFITLRPEHLGDMSIRFIQVNDEIVVKMIVSSQAVKNILETNLHQLKQTFSPHQIIIEKDDVIHDNQDIHKDQDEPLEENEDHETEQQEEERNKQADDSFKQMVQEMMAEEV